MIKALLISCLLFLPVSAHEQDTAVDSLVDDVFLLGAIQSLEEVREEYEERNLDTDKVDRAIMRARWNWINHQTQRSRD